jgi:hypothetical protein
MKYLIGLLCLFSVAQAQFAPTSAKTKFVNGIGIGSKDTSQFTAADTIALTIARDSVMYYRYRGFWRPIATGGNLSAYKLISDTLFNNGYTTRARLKQGLDSLAATKVNISDTASMLAPYFRDSDTTGLLNQVVRTFGAQTVFGIKAFGDSMRIGAGLSVLRIQADAGISLSQELNIRKNTNSLSTDFLKIGTSVGSGILYGSYIKSTSNHLSFTGNDMVLGVTNTSGNNVDAISISSAGVTSINSLSTAGIVTNTSAGVLGTTSIVPIANGGTGSSTQNFVDLTTSQTITGQKTFNVSGNSGNVIINHGSGSGVALNITKGGNGEGLIVNKTSGSGNAATITGTLEATTLVKNGGTSSQFLKADGSVDNNTYTTTSQNALKLNISDTAAMLLPYTRVQRFTDSLTNVQSRIQTKQNILTLTTTGTSGAATLVGSTLNIPQYQSVLTNPVTGTGTTNYLPKFTGSTIGNSIAYIQNNEFVVQGTTYGAINARSASGNANYLFFTENGVADRYLIGSPAGSGDLVFRSNSYDFSSGNERMRLNTSGNLGLGVTPSAWNTPFKVMQLGGTTAIWDISSVSGFSNNLYNDGTSRYLTSNFATIFQQWDGGFAWLQAPSGTAGNAITFTQAMTLGANGNLLLNTTTDNGARLQVAGSATFSGSVTTNGNFVLATAGQRIAFDNNLRYILPVTPADRLRIAQNAFATGIEIGFDNGTSFSPSLTFATTGAATFSSSVTVGGLLNLSANTWNISSEGRLRIQYEGNGRTLFRSDGFQFQNNSGSEIATISSTGAATFSSLAGTGDRLVQANSSGELSATQTIASGTYTPTITDNLNTSSYTVQHASYTRIGNICTVYMRVSFTASSSVCGINVTIPVGNNFSNSNQATGSNGNGANGLVMYNSTASASTNQIFTSMSGATVGSNTISFSFQYQVQ